ncbi:MAG: hypothetical protein WEE64_13890 [Dehalococcoidia bacterium]
MPANTHFAEYLTIDILKDQLHSGSNIIELFSLADLITYAEPQVWRP